MKKIIKYIITDILRNKIILSYTAFLLLISFTIFSLEDSSSKGMLSMLNIVLIIVPLISLIFSAIYIYNSAEFIELLVSQPLRRSKIWFSLFTGLATSFTIAYFLGVGVPVLIFEPSPTGLMILFTGILLSVIFVAIAMLAAVIIRDKAKGIGIAILIWLYFSLLFDGLVLFLLFQFADYPLEKAMMVVSTLNPIDISRILILLKMDVSALMGYTGAIFKNFFGTTTGISVSFIILILWTIIPLYLSTRKFIRKDL